MLEAVTQVKSTRSSLQVVMFPRGKNTQGHVHEAALFMQHKDFCVHSGSGVVVLGDRGAEFGQILSS